ncbi:SDR family NAD(P)-dependent oxidoreductase [Nocardia sp. NPDC049149]|uniref:SDR family NAD(P)-dependent oxidoreductase n=1 Tax=Nocardia sp. NPDC049149 TaxID=3364315 RepID=UPI00371B1CAA
MTEQAGVVLITGAASGMGLATAQLLSERGYAVEGADLVAPADAGFPVAAVDVADGAAVRRWVADVTARHEKVDALITFAGYAIKGAVEETDPDEAAALLNVNLLGTARAVRAVLPVLRGQGAGRVVLVSSGAAITAMPFGGWYSASKAAIEKLGEAMRLETAGTGIQVTTLVPGWTRTPIFTSARETRIRIDEYRGAAAEVDRRLADFLDHGQEPAAIADAVATILTARRVRGTYRVGKDVRRSHLARRLLPAALYERSVNDYYGIGVSAPVSTFTTMPPMIDPASRAPLTEATDGSLVTADGTVGLQVLDRRLRLYRDANAAPPADADRKDTIRLAYRIYSKAYPIVATLLFWVVWRGNLRALGKFCGDQMRSAQTKGTAFVEVGVGDGSLTKFAVRTAKVKNLPSLLFVDLSPDMLVKAAKRFRKADNMVALVQDATTLGLAPGSVRSLGCYGALHVFPDPSAVLHHLAGLLADDGELSLSVLTSPGVGWKDRLIERAVSTGTITSNFTVTDVEQLLTKAGLETVETVHNGHQLLIRTRRSTSAA